MKQQTAIIGVLAVIIIGAVVLLSSTTKAPTQTKGLSSSSTSISSVISSVADTMSALADGTYTAQETYTTPGAPEDLSITISLKDGMVIDANVAMTPKDDKATFFFGNFSKEYKSQVVGKKIADIQLSRVGGASLTTGAFNSALQKVIAQAKK